MLKVSPIQTKEEQKKICGLCQVEYNPDCLAYSVKDDSNLLGISQFRLFGETAVIYDLTNAVGINDLDALIITGKATLNFIDSCGIKDVIMDCRDELCSSAINLSKTLGFKRDDNGIWRVNLEGYFESPCQKS